MALLNGQELDRCPDDLQVLLFLQAFPGYTRTSMMQESAAFVERARLWLLLQARKK